MNLRTEFDAVMNQTCNMALATSVGNIPNVRVVTFAYDPATPQKVYFTTFKGNQKIGEFAQNSNVTFLPLPENPASQTQVRVQGHVQPSARSLEEIAPLILPKFPEYAQTVQQAGPMLEVYEIAFAQAAVTIGMTDAQLLTF